MERRRYHYSGLCVVSDLEIPEWATYELPGSEDDPDVEIVLGDNRVHEPSYTSQVSAGTYRFHVPEVGTYSVDSGRVIEVSPAPGADMREIRLFLLGSAWGALCYQRGLLVVHASAVCTGDSAAAFCAPQGCGKSSLVACLTMRGCTFLSDDLCRIELRDPGKAVIHPSTPRLKLRHDAVDALGRGEDKLEPDHFRTGKLQLPATNVARAPVPLHAIYLLDRGEPGIVRLRGRAALSRFVSAATYRPQLLEPLGRIGDYWRECLELTRRVPVWLLTRSRDFGTIEATIDELIEHMSHRANRAEENDAGPSPFHCTSHNQHFIQQIG